MTKTLKILIAVFMISSISLMGARSFNEADVKKITPSLKQRYSRMLLPEMKKINSPAFADFYKTRLLPQFKRINKDFARLKKKEQVKKLYMSAILVMAYSYKLNAPDNPYYHNADTLKNILKFFKYMNKTEGISTLRPGSYCRAVFLMEKELREHGLLEEARENMLDFFGGKVAYESQEKANSYRGKIIYPKKEMDLKKFVKSISPAPYKIEFSVSSDAFRIAIDGLIPYILLLEDSQDKVEMFNYLVTLINNCIETTPAGYADSIKPDGTTWHHLGAYMSAYSNGMILQSGIAAYLLNDYGCFSEKAKNSLRKAIYTYSSVYKNGNTSVSLKGRGPVGSWSILHAVGGMLFFAETLNDDKMRREALRILRNAPQRQIFSSLRSKIAKPLQIFELYNELITAGLKPADEPELFQFKPYGCFAILRDKDWMVLTKGFSKYMWDYEGPIKKKENIFGQNYSHGHIDIFSGNSPYNAASLADKGYDWYQLPGTTAHHFKIKLFTKAELDNIHKTTRRHGGQHRRFSSSTFAGGVELDKANGLFAMELEDLPFELPSTLKAKKSVFFFGDYIVAVGNDISGGNGKDEVHTTICQSYVDTVAKPLLDSKEVKDDFNITINKKNTVIRDAQGIGYVVIDPSALEVKKGIQHSIYPSPYKKGVKIKTKGKYFTARFNHGVNPRDKSYKYMIIKPTVFAKSQGTADEFTQKINIISDSSTAHIVEYLPEKITGYACFKPGSIDDKLLKSVSYPSIIMSKAKSDKEIELAASVPDLGWLKKNERNSFGLAHRKYMIIKNEPVKALQITLKGTWKLKQKSKSITVAINADSTVVTVQASGGRTYKANLIKNQK
jgi:chondroitin-sulfate-ABC endolyase/exolyase